MDDDLPKTQPTLLTALAQEDLSELSKFELEERLARLKAEIKRTEGSIDARGGSKAAAEALFSKP